MAAFQKAAGEPRVAHTCGFSIPEAKAGGLQVQGQPLLHSEILSQKTKQGLGHSSVGRATVQEPPGPELKLQYRKKKKKKKVKTTKNNAEY
jgi:hypothetical protein